MLVLVAGFAALPLGVNRAWDALKAPDRSVIDLVPLRDAERTALVSVMEAESSLAQLRQSATTSHDSAEVPRETPEADTLVAAIASLDRLLRRATDAPLLESYRALGTSAALRGDARVGALLDSLGDVERERDEFGSGAAVDPLFVALTTRANTLGRSIIAAATVKRQSYRSALAAIRQRHIATADSTPAPPDTTRAVALRAQRYAALEEARRRLARAIESNAAAHVAASQFQPPASFGTLAAGSTVLIVALLFTFALGNEIRSPRVADATEAERLADARVLSVVRPRRIPDERMRRASDVARPMLLDPQLDAYRMLAWHVTAHVPRDGILVVTGDVPATSAAIAANIAAVLANEARATLLVDIDFSHPLMADIMGIPSVPGIAAVLENKRRWSETVVQVTTGRGRMLDCIPAGVRARAVGPAEQEALGNEIRRASRRYDLTIVHAPLQLARQAMRGGDAMVCATLAHTRLSKLVRTASALRDDGGRVLGVALWEGDEVHIPLGSRLRPHSGTARRLARA